MNKIEKLINKLCPDGVEYKELGKIWDRAPKSKLGVNKIKTLKNGNIICFTSGSKNHMIDDYLVDGEYIFVNDGGIADFKYNKGKAYYTDHVFAFGINTTDINAKFIYYLLLSKQAFINKSMFQGTTLKNLKKNDFANLLLPIPPISIQKKIVKILDKFTELETDIETKIETELKLRKKQYEYYRNQLLTPVEINSKWYLNSKEVELKELEQSGVNIFSGKNKKRDDKGKYNVYGSTGIIGKTNNYIYDKEQILIARVGSAGFVNIAKGKYDVSDNTLIVQIINENEIKFKFLYYLLIFLKLNQFAKGAAQPLITASQIKKLKIPVPPISEQNRIAIILDKFTELEIKLEKELEKELKLRKKQYEHYREKLLTFKKKK